VIEKRLRDFKKNGLMLTPEKREQLKTIRKSALPPSSPVERVRASALTSLTLGLA
jgi:hypothetical protein